MFKLVLEKAEEPEIKLPTSAGSSKKQESSRKTSISALLYYAKASDCMDHNKLWKILKEMGIPDHLTCLLRNLYAGQEATGITDSMDVWTLGVGDGQGGLACCDSWGRKESDTTEQVNWTELKQQLELDMEQQTGSK